MLRISTKPAALSRQLRWLARRCERLATYLEDNTGSLGGRQLASSACAFVADAWWSLRKIEEAIHYWHWRRDKGDILDYRPRKPLQRLTARRAA